MMTHALVTDVHLLGLAIQKGGKLATLDQRLPAMAIQQGIDGLEVIIA